MSSNCNALARVFLSDVNKLCSEGREAKDDDDDEEENHMAVLGDYLLNGRGLVLLTMLNNSVDQDLTCREELITLILSLLPLVWKIPLQDEKARDFPLLSLERDLFTIVERFSSLHKQKRKAEDEDVSHSDFFHFLNVNIRHKSRHQSKNAQCSTSKGEKKSMSSSDSEAPIDGKTSTGFKSRHSLKPAVCPSWQSAVFDKGSIQQKEKHEAEPDSNISQNIAVKEPASTSDKNPSPFDLCQILLSLLEKVSMFDIVLNHSSSLSVIIIPALTEFLLGFGDCDASPKGTLSTGWTEEEVALVQRMLLRTVLGLLCADILSRDVMPDNLRKNLNDLLKTALNYRSFLNERIEVQQQQLTQGTVDNPEMPSSQNQTYLIPEIIEGVFQITLLCLRCAAPNPSYFSQSMELLHEFIQHSGFHLLEITVLYLEFVCLHYESLYSQACQHVSLLIDGIIKIVSVIKKVKSEQLHQSLCTRKRHRRCDFSHFMHHHRDLSGLPISVFKTQVLKNPFEEDTHGQVQYPERSCCIAVCAHQCLRLLQQVSLTPACLQILLGIQNVGICCCMDPASIVIPLLYAFKLPRLKNVQNHILTLLSNLILDQLGGGEILNSAKQASCNICAIDGEHLAELEDTIQGKTGHAVSASLCSTSQRFQGVLPNSGSEDMMWKWDSLEAYQELVFGNDPHLSILIAHHICVIIQKANAVIQWKLYTLIFNPVLQRGVEMAHHSQQMGISTMCYCTSSYHKTCLSEEVLKIYLKVLPELLKSSVICEIFLNSNGLNQITELIYLDAFRGFSLKAFETLIGFGEQQIDCLTPNIEIGSGDSNPLALEFHARLSMPQQWLQDVHYGDLKEICPKRKKAISQKTNIINLFLCLAFLSVSKDAESDFESVNESEDTSGYDSTASEPRNILPKLNTESLTLPSSEKISKASEIWSLFCFLYLSNVMLQKQFHKIGGFELCYKLIHLIINTFASCFEELKTLTFPEPHLEKFNKVVEESSDLQLPYKDESTAQDVLSKEVYLHQSLPDAQFSTLDSLNRASLTNVVKTWPVDAVKLLETLLAICLHSARNSQLKTDLECTQSLTVQHIMVEIQDLLAQSKVLQTNLAPHILDCLLRIAVSNFCLVSGQLEEQKEKVHKPDELNLQPREISDEAEEVYSVNVSLLAEEEGYDADSESNPEDASDDEEPKTDPEDAEGVNDEADFSRDGELLYPEICTLVLNLLSEELANLKLLTSVFQNLLKIMKTKKKNTMLLVQQGTTNSLLMGFKHLLGSNDPTIEVCQEVLVDLFVTLMSYSVTSYELSLLLHTFLEKELPVEMLLKGILSITEAHNSMTPLKYLTFPLQQGPSGTCGTAQKSPGFGTGKMSGFFKKTKIWQNKETHCDSLLSSWNVAPIHLPLVGQNCWPHMSDGFSFSTWLKIEYSLDLECLLNKGKPIKKKSKAFPTPTQSTGSDKTSGQDGPSNESLLDDGCIHVISVGSKVLMIQIWASMMTGRLIFRICTHVNDEFGCVLLAQAITQEHVFHPGCWEHLSFTYKELPESKNKVCSKILMWVSGQRKAEITLEYNPPRKGSLSSDSNRTFCLIGHHLTSQDEILAILGNLHLGNVLLFNGPSLGADEAFDLYCRGPDFTSLMNCKHGNSIVDHCKHISKDILQNEKIYEFLMKNQGIDLSALTDSLAVVYDMLSPAQYTIYEPVIRIKGSMKTSSAQRPFSAKDVSSKILDAQALKMLLPCLEKNIHSVLHEFGGIRAMVYLFARIVEIGSCEKTQSLGLQIVLSLTKCNQQRIQESENCDLYSMIHQILINPKCIVGFHTLKTLLHGCTGDWLLYLNENGQCNLNVDSTAVIKDIRLLEHLLLDWKIWSKAEAGVWESLLSALEVLIRDSHPYKIFNITQLLKASVVHHFLLTCQILQEHREEHITSIPQKVCASYIRIIQEVLGSPPELDLLKLIFSFLLAVHPPTNTYVCHNPNNFFFSLHIDDKIFQEKLKSVLYQRHSLGAQNVFSPVISRKSPEFIVYTTYFLLLGTDGTMFSSQPHIHLSVADRSRSKSLPASPSCSPKTYPKRLGGSLEKSIVALPESTDDQNSKDKLCSTEHQLEVLKKKEEYVSSCESAQTVCETLVLPDSITIIEPSKEDLGDTDISLENIAEDKVRCESVGEVFLERPHVLKGISMSRKGQGPITSFGLAFPSSGSLSSSSLTDVSEKKNPEEWGSFPFSPMFALAHTESESTDGRSMDGCIHLVCCGLYDLLCGVVLTMPDVMVMDVFTEIIQPDVLIVLVNHPSPLIQQGVLKLLNAYFHRASKENKEAFLKKSGFTLLANQLYLHQGSQRVIECLLELLLGRRIGLDDEFESEDVRSVATFQKWFIIPILGLLENSLHDATLLHNTFCLLLQILNSCSKVADMLLDSGLLYALCNTLATLCAIETSISLDEYILLACDLQQLFIAVTIHSCSSSGPQYFRIIEDLIILLGYLNETKNEMLQNMAVLMQFKILHSAVEFIKTTSCQDPQFACSFSHSSHSKHSKRKSVGGAHRLSFAQSDPLLMTMRSVASSELTELMQRRMSQENPIRASESEFIQRLQRLTVLSVNRFIYQEFSEKKTYPGSQVELSEDEMQLDVTCVKKAFQSDLLKIMFEGIKLSLSSGRASSPRHQWKTILLQCNDTFRVQLGRLLVHLLSPSQENKERKEVLEIVNEPKHEDILKECLCPGLHHGPKLALYLFELLHYHKDELTKEDEAAGVLFMNAIKQAGYRCLPPGAPLKPDLVKAATEEQEKYENEERSNKAAWKKTILSNQQKLFQRLDSKLKDISKIAGEITQSVSLCQGMERKNVIQHIRNMYKVDLSASRHWHELVQQLTHDRAVWYDPESYPMSYQLDPTEGPNRERRRLQRCYLTIPNKYILKDRQRKEESVKPPLSYIFEEKTHSSLSSTVKEKAASELIRVNRRCINVAPSRETIGELLLGKTGMYFVEDSSPDAVESNSLSESEPASFSWTYEEIKEVHKRWWQLRDNAVEIFLTNGRTLLLAFDNTKVRDDVYQKILSNNLPNLLEYGNITALTQLWCSGQITNFEYLTHLNKHAGRSFNDLMQYPVFPFILNDYSNETLDLSNTNIYRNLAKPIAVQSKEKEDRYIDNYKYLEDEYCKGDREDDPMPPVQPYHYGSHYSNSGTVLHFMVRMPPFTKMFLAYQDQSFDIPDRTFHSMNTTWRLSSFESMTDVKELIPEFFYLPEFLVNREGFDFGVRQNGERVNHVNLPPWARNDPRLFILIHRQALESDHVSQTICNWIDLVFGYKQKGRAAVQAINVFHPATYFGMDVSAVEDPVQRRALETMIKTYGQTPRQLFQSAHVSRPGSKLMEGELPAAMGLLVQFAFRENKENVKEPAYPSPLPWIRGLKWGEYVGSPSAPDPIVCFSQPHGERFGSLLALPTRAICGLSKKFCLMMSYSKEQGVRSMHSTDIQWSAILSWGYPDNILRLKSKQSEPPVNFIQCSELHQVTSCAWVPESFQLYTGSKCGVITAYLNRFTNTTPMEIEVESQVHLYGHTAEVTGLFVCKPYSILISVSKDGTCIIWDLNRLLYVQSLTGHKSPVTAVSASETTGDIATVCDSVGGGSDLRLWTVNGDLIGHVHCREIVCSVAFSNQPEGISVNVIAGGLENGIVRLWSTWDLKPVREITFPKSNKPIVSLTFSCDGHHLYTANSEGTVIGWCRKDQQRLKLPMFYSFLSNYSAC
ncbi:lysosomal-trafficking regulator [Gastrophryne carolinensis]